MGLFLIALMVLVSSRLSNDYREYREGKQTIIPLIASLVSTLAGASLVFHMVLEHFQVIAWSQVSFVAFLCTYALMTIIRTASHIAAWKRNRSNSETHFP